MNNNICSKIDSCYKIGMILDKDFAFDEQYTNTIRTVCGKCDERQDKLITETDIICTFCNEKDFDFRGLKYHLMNYCEVYKEVESLTN